MDPAFLLLKIFLLLNEKHRSFSYGDIAVKDTEGALMDALSKRSIIHNGDAFELVLRTPIQQQCNCDSCCSDTLHRRAVRFWHSPNKFNGEPVLMMRLVEHSAMSLLGALEWVNNWYTATLPKKMGCPTRYSDDKYTTLALLGDEIVFAGAEDCEVLKEYNRSARVGNEFFMVTDLELNWER